MIRWATAAGAFVISLDSTMNIAFPAIVAEFAVAPERVRWVIVAYVLVYAVTSLAGGALGDRIGHGRVFRAGLALSVAAFVMGGLAPTFGWLLAARVVQGLGGGGVYGTSPGLVTLGVPAARRGRALGFLGAAMGLGLSVGPVIAGVLVDLFGWRAVFHFRLPLAVAVLAWAWAAMPASSIWLVAVALFAAGFGLGVFQVPNMAVTMAAFPVAHQGAAGGAAFLARTLGVVAGVLGLAQLFAMRRLVVGLAAAAAEAFVAAALAVALAALLAALIRDARAETPGYTARR
jgi:MFS family permease